MKVGRAPIADIRITDISVSRFHSNLYLCKDGTLCVVDNFSKFGTLKLIQQPLEVSSQTNEAIYVQVGRAVLSISSEQEHSCLQKLKCCFKLNKKLLDNNALHYEEAACYFPQEFNWKFRLYPISQKILLKKKLIGEENLALSLSREKQKDKSEFEEIDDYPDSPRLGDTNRFAVANPGSFSNTHAPINLNALGNSLRNTTALFDYTNTPMASATYRGDQTNRKTQHLKESLSYKNQITSATNLNYHDNAQILIGSPRANVVTNVET